jgi:hypothetical protein
MTYRRWYNYLVPSNSGGEKGPNLFQSENLNKDSVVLCQKMKFLKFAKFDGVMDAAMHVLKTVASHSCFYELIRGTQTQKFYMDIDIHLEKENEEICIVEEEESSPISELISNIHKTIPKMNMKKTNDFTMKAKDTYNVVYAIKSSLLKILPMIRESDILVTSSNGEKKHSYHVILDNWCVANHLENKALFKEVFDDIPEQYRGALDCSMYKSNQQFRMYNSHKFESPRVKVFNDDLSTWTTPVEPVNDKHQMLLRIAGSMVLNTASCCFLPSFIKVTEKTYDKTDSSNLNKESAKLVMEMFRSEFKNANAFTYESFDGCFINLKRNRASMCYVCNRVHQSENPYILVVGQSRSIFFDCRRADMNVPKTYIGQLGPVGGYYEDEEKPEPEPMKIRKEVEITKPTIRNILKGLTVNMPSKPEIIEIVKPVTKRIIIKRPSAKRVKIKIPCKKPVGVPRRCIDRERESVIVKFKPKAVSHSELLCQKMASQSENNDMNHDLSGIDKINEMQRMSRHIFSKKKKKKAKNVSIGNISFGNVLFDSLQGL